MKRYLVLLPTVWDRRHLEPRRSGNRPLAISMEGPPDHDCPWDFDGLSLVERAAERYRGKIDGVLSTSDYPGAILAALLAERLGLPGAPPRSVVTASHKYACRRALQAAVPEALPEFQLVDPESPVVRLPFPCFVKPIKGSFSMLARRVSSPEELRAFLAGPAVREYLRRYVVLFDTLRAHIAPDLPSARAFVAETCLTGRLVTVEGYVTGDAVGFLGIVDSHVHPETGSFLGFDYPSTLAGDVQERMRDIARRAVGALGLRHTSWNIEMFHDPEQDRLSIVEVNPRLAGQFADLYEKVDGVNGYDVALALAAGETMGKPAGGRFRAAASTPLRVFRPSRALRVPDAETVARIERKHDAFIWVECETGQEIGDFDLLEDGASARVAVVNQGGAGREEIAEQFGEIERELGFVFQPIDGA